jgi:MFS family permease
MTVITIIARRIRVELSGACAPGRASAGKHTLAGSAPTQLEMQEPTATHPTAPARGGVRVRAVLGAPGAPALLVARTAGSLPIGMVGLGIVLLLRAHGHSYALAGLVVGAYSLGVATGGPVLGRLVDRLGMERVLLPLGVCFPAALVALIVAASESVPAVVLVVFGLACGATIPPLGACMRAMWPLLVEGPALRTAAFSIDAVLQELAWIGGPPLLAGLVVLGGPAVALSVAAAAGGGGTLAFALCVRGRHVRGVGGGGALRSARVRRILAMSAVLGGAFGSMEVSLPAFCEHHGARPAAGLIMAAIALGSASGGVLLSARGARSAPLQRLIVALFAYALLLLPMLVAPSLAVMAVCGFVAGAPIAPAFTGAYVLLDRFGVAGAGAETFAWNSSAIFIGGAGGTAVGGALIASAGGYRSALILSVSLALAAAVTIAVQRRSLA